MKKKWSFVLEGLGPVEQWGIQGSAEGSHFCMKKTSPREIG